MSLFAYPQTGERETAGGRDSKGRWQDGTIDPLEFAGTIQPLTGKEIESLPVGRVDEGAVKVYSKTALIVSKEGGTSKGDIVFYNGIKWEVVYELPYQNKLIQHFKYVAEYRGPVA